MKTTRIGILYSEGPHWKQALHAIALRWPEAEIRAWNATSLSETDGPLICREGGGNPRSLLRAIRAERLDAFVVMFNSDKLRMLAGASGAQTCFHAGLDGALIPLPSSFFRALVYTLQRRGHGLCVFIQAWLAVHFLSSRD